MYYFVINIHSYNTSYPFMVHHTMNYKCDRDKMLNLIPILSVDVHF